MSRKHHVPLLERFGRRLSPFWVLFGIVAGFVLMVQAGRWAGRRNLFSGYQRSYIWISAEGYFYPSLNNLTRLINAVADPGKTLVLVGGDSVLVGVGQPKEQVWTRELQRLLGPDFKVVNVAFRGAGPTEMGAVVAEVLSKRYRRLIYIARDDMPLLIGPPSGFTYSYLFWQAMASGGLLNFAPRLEEFKLTQMSEPSLRGYFDYWTHASDLWNYIGYNYLFTVFDPLKYPPERFFTPVRKLDDEAYQNTALLPIPERFLHLKEQSMQIIRSVFQNRVISDPRGELSIAPGVLAAFTRDAQAAFPDALKHRTLILLSYNAPYLTRQLSRDEYAAYDFIYHQGAMRLQQAGYHSMLVGSDWSDEDFADRVHLSPFGGQKMAREIAPEIRAMAFQLGYIPTVAATRYP